MACKLLIPRIRTLNHILCESDSMMKAHSMLLVLRIRWCHVTYAEVYHGFLELGTACFELLPVNATTCVLSWRWKHEWSKSVSYWLCVYSYAWLWNHDGGLYLHVVRQFIVVEATLNADSNDFECGRYLMPLSVVETRLSADSYYCAFTFQAYFG